MTYLCPYFRSSMPCPNLTLCPYWHGSPDPSAFGPQQSTVAPPNYKTKKCRHFDMGRCKLASFCNFAHGDEELRMYRNDAATSSENSKASQENNSLKLQQLEQNLEFFSHTQALILEQLKSLALSFDSSNGQYSEQSVGQIEECVKRFHKSAEKYSETISKLTEGKKTEIEEPETNQGESEGDEQTKAQLQFLIAKLRPIHARNPKVVDILARAECVLDSNVFQAATLLEEIIYDKSLSKGFEAVHKNILNEARTRK